MASTPAPTAASAVPGDGPLPPVQQLAIASLVLIIIGGIDMAGHLPRHAPTGPVVGLLAAAAAVWLVNVVLLARIKPFSWRAFRQVAGWAALAYVVIAGMLEYVFVLDHTRGTQLLILTGMLIVFAANIPLLLGFSVARFQEP
jgi:hypothetical protein